MKKLLFGLCGLVFVADLSAMNYVQRLCNGVRAVFAPVKSSSGVTETVIKIGAAGTALIYGVYKIHQLQNQVSELNQTLANLTATQPHLVDPITNIIENQTADPGNDQMVRETVGIEIHQNTNRVLHQVTDDNLNEDQRINQAVAAIQTETQDLVIPQAIDGDQNNQIAILERSIQNQNETIEALNNTIAGLTQRIGELEQNIATLSQSVDELQSVELNRTEVQLSELHPIVLKKNQNINNAKKDILEDEDNNSEMFIQVMDLNLNDDENSNAKVMIQGKNNNYYVTTSNTMERGNNIPASPMLFNNDNSVVHSNFDLSSSLSVSSISILKNEETTIELQFDDFKYKGQGINKIAQGHGEIISKGLKICGTFQDNQLVINSECPVWFCKSGQKYEFKTGENCQAIVFGLNEDLAKVKLVYIRGGTSYLIHITNNKKENFIFRPTYFYKGNVNTSSHLPHGKGFMINANTGLAQQGQFKNGSPDDVETVEDSIIQPENSIQPLSAQLSVNNE